MTEPAATVAPARSAVDQLAGHIVTLLTQGQSQERVATILVDQGWDEETARQFVQTVAAALEDHRNSPEGRAALALNYLKHLGFGALWFFGGGFFMAFTYGAAWLWGGAHFVAFGVIIAGLVEFVWGLTGYRKHRPL